MAKKKRKSYQKRSLLDNVQDDVMGLTGAGIGIGVGAMTVGAIENKTGKDYGLTSAFGTAGRMMGPLTAGVMGMRTLQAVRSYAPKKRKAKRRK